MELKSAVQDYFFSTVAQYVMTASIRMLLTQYVLYWGIQIVAQNGRQEKLDGVYNLLTL